MNKMQFLLNGNIHPSSVMPAIATALSSQTDSTAVRAEKAADGSDGVACTNVHNDSELERFH